MLFSLELMDEIQHLLTAKKAAKCINDTRDHEFPSAVHLWFGFGCHNLPPVTARLYRSYYDENKQLKKQFQIWRVTKFNNAVQQ